MDTINRQTTPATRPRYFTVMSGLPSDLNREQALSLLSSVSQVVSLNILRVHREGLPVNRIGLVEVEDNESVYRLTSRQFLVRKNQAVKHKMISPSARLVQHLGNKDITLKLKFYSTERGASRQVTDFFERYGELCVISMKAHAGYHEMLFKVSRDYSIRHLTTDLLVRVGGIVVEVEYPENDLNFDYYQQDLDLLLEIQSSLEFCNGLTLEHNSSFFNPSVPGPALSLNEPKTMWFVDKEYYIGDDEDDCLSIAEEDIDENSNSIVFTPLSIQADKLMENHYSNDTSGKNYFSESRNRLVLTRLNDNLALQAQTESKQLGTKIDKRKSKNSNTILPTQEDISSTQDKVSDILPEIGSPLDSMIKSKKNKKRRHKKAIAPSLAQNIASAGQTQNEVLNTDLVTETVGSLRSDTEFPISSNLPLQTPESDGSKLLKLIWPTCHDFASLNELIMPEVHSKWKRFVEIKDEMRKERYNDYLRQRAQETTSLATTVQQDIAN